MYLFILEDKKSPQSDSPADRLSSTIFYEEIYLYIFVSKFPIHVAISVS